MTQPTAPRRLDTDISVERVGDETLIYDERRHQAFCLNRTSAAVWRLCDGARTLGQIADAATLELAEPITEDIVLFALDQLQRDSLLKIAPPPSLPHLSRRELMEKLGVRALVLLPVVAAVLVPEAAKALSGGVYGSQPTLGARARVRQSILDQQAAAASQQDSGSSNSSR